jgi:hypothetical protein
VFGVCADFETTLHSLTSSPLAQRLLNDALERKMWLVAPRGRDGKVRDKRRVHARAAEAAGHVLLTSAAQTLAGPCPSDAPPRGSHSWVGRAATELFERIFRSHLDNISRRCDREDGHLQDRGPDWNDEG